ncbi:hypothetical protein ABL78_5801 [Leptomonas seymouri]|uniref:Uncharacterized protein n=1 Tax=Leptomonas seymouri TaxID=5684 RepID=A0A0N1PC80_LEPSE|nr:hypothetical protein ABL78_5801 [Leptomonas seymouri]|eukprot:KPI85141.1 hypothetical protein ABL78_5801 [Leptomonas seymouri]
MDVNSHNWRTARPRVHMIVLFLFLLTDLINLVCYILYISNDWNSFGVAGCNAYIAFTCIGIVVFSFVCAPLIYWPYVHGNEMSPVSRRNAMCLGILISFVVHDFPMAWIELWIVTTYGWTEYLQGISLFLTLLCFIIGFIVTWFSYSWKLSKVLQIRYGNAAPTQSSVPAAQVAKHSSRRYQI